MSGAHRCQVCDAAALEAIDDYTALPRVTSDCKPWPAGGTLTACSGCGTVQKLPDERWLDEIRRIYAAYEIYHLSAGSEQVIFAGDAGGRPRSRLLIERVVALAGLAEHGSLIDIGCGNGAALASYAEHLPGWALHGTELSDASLPRLRRLENFVELYTVPLREISRRFDLVSMVHSLEHMVAPLEVVREAAGLLEDEGTLLIDIPDVETSPFDLLVADHLTHFSRASLGLLVARAGIAVSSISNTAIAKEITLTGRRGREATSRTDPSAGDRIARTTVAWLQAVLDAAATLAASGPFGLFGTSISGMWLYGALRERVEFFVDEDPTRIGRSYEGRPILGPRDVPRRANVFVPLIPTVAGSVLERLGGQGARYVAPPERAVA